MRLSTSRNTTPPASELSRPPSNRPVTERTVDAGNETDIRGVVVFVGNTV